ncbi:hypothetical protein [Tomitella fengzijianii]|nr:hypothetical protein [Tomitella fengzijianii]
MPRSLDQVLRHADELGRRFEEHEPAGADAGALRAIRDAVEKRAQAERLLAEAVRAARSAGISWSAIGAMVGTSGEAVRKRYCGRLGESA